MFIANTKKILSKLSISDCQIILLTIFFLIYSFFSSNVPKVLDIEHYIMFIISIMIGCLYIYDSKNLGLKNFFYKNFAPLLVFIVLIYGLILGLLLNNLDRNIIRDMIGVSSILSIFLLINFRNKNQKILNYLVKILVLCGLIFSIKVLIFYNFFFSYSDYPHGDTIKVAKYYFLYLENTITLSLVFFILKIYEHVIKRKFTRVIKYSFLSILPIYVMDIYALRGPIISIFLIFIFFLCIRKKSFNGLLFSLIFLISSFFSFLPLILYPLFYFLINFKKRNIYLILSFFFLLFILDHIYLWSSGLSDLTHQNILEDQKIKKSSINFFNNREDEFFFLTNDNNFFSIILGKGFGSLFENPINNSRVLFFHSFFLYYFYKLGIVGVIFVISIFYMIILKSFKIFKNFKKLNSQDRLINISLLSTISYPLILSATYKSVSFGFILALFLVFKINYNDRKNI